MTTHATLAGLALALMLSSAQVAPEPLAQAVAADYPYLESLFKELHANPELSMQEVRTSDRLAEELERLGYKVTRPWSRPRLQNGLAEPTITHWHGLVVNFANDGGPLLDIAPGQFYDYNFQIVQRAGLNFYHPHPHMLTGKQVCLGLAGAFIVRDDEEDGLGLPAGAYEVPLVIRDASFDKQGGLLYNAASSGFSGKFPLVNGTLVSGSTCWWTSARCVPGRRSRCGVSGRAGICCAS